VTLTEAMYKVISACRWSFSIN